MITGEVLFKPGKGDEMERDLDHISIIMDLIGEPPKTMMKEGKYIRDFFTTKVIQNI